MPALVPVRYGRMLVSPFSFFRGAPSCSPRIWLLTPTSGLTAQLCGDAHLSNFGVFASPERYLYFDVNDFDESAPGPWEWDLKRLAASLEVAGRDNGYSREQRKAIVRSAVRSYQRGHDRVLGHVDARRLVCASRHRPAAASIPFSVECRQDAPASGTRSQRHACRTAIGRSTCSPRWWVTSRGSPADPPVIVPIEELGLDLDSAGPEMASCDDPLVRTNAPARVAASARPIPPRPCCAQGRRGRKRGRGHVDRPASRACLRLAVVPPGKARRSLGARAVRTERRILQPRTEGRLGAAADAGNRRHLPGMGARHPRRP